MRSRAYVRAPLCQRVVSFSNSNSATPTLFLSGQNAAGGSHQSVCFGIRADGDAQEIAHFRKPEPPNQNLAIPQLLQPLLGREPGRSGKDEVRGAGKNFEPKLAQRLAQAIARRNNPSEI